MLTNVLRDYSRYFIGDQYAEDFAQGLLALESDWHGALLTNESVFATLKRFQAMEQSASPQLQGNWRFQQGLFTGPTTTPTRAVVCLYENRTGRQATAKTWQAKKARLPGCAVRGGGDPGTRCGRIAFRPSGARARPSSWLEALYRSIGMQLSVPLYQAESVDRGANLDNIDVPLNDRPWFERTVLGEIRKLPEEEERLKRIDEIVRWTDPRSGRVLRRPGQPSQPTASGQRSGFENDPAFFRSALVDFGYKRRARFVWNNASSLMTSR